jgi:hypothetical protein
MLNTRAFVCAGLLVLALLPPHPAAAAWPADPLVNVPLCTATGTQDYPVSVADGAGGTFVIWVDDRNGSGDIYAQKISATGTVQWTTDGVPLCTAGGEQFSPAVVADDAGGAIVTWSDGRSGTHDLYAQRISAAGTPAWTANGVALCTAGGSQWSPAIVADGEGGAVIAWLDGRNGGNDDLYAQRISAAGAVQWAANGVALCTAPSSPGSLAIASDGAGGAIVAWDDYRTSSYDIYVQRISAAGAAQWTANGVALCAATGGQYSPSIVSDDAGGAIVTWFDQRNGDYDIYAQRILAGGMAYWTANGVALCTNTAEQYYPAIVANGAGGALVTWFDQRSGNYDIYAQKISLTGAVQWTANGVALCTASGTQWYPAIVADGAGGAIVTWTDARGASDDIYAQKISTGGAVQWTANGVALCTASGWQGLGSVVMDGAGGAIATWVDGRSGNLDIYAQSVKANGELGSVLSAPGADAAPLAFALEPVRPNPWRGGALTVRFTLAGAAPAALELFDVAGRRVAARELGPLGAGPHALDLAEGQHLAPGLYLVCLRQGARTRVTRVAVLR